MEIHGKEYGRNAERQYAGVPVFKPENKPLRLTQKAIFFTLTSSGTRFSIKAVEVMGNPEAAIVLFDTQDRMLVIPSKLSEPNSMYLANPGAGKRYKNLLKMQSLNIEILHRMKAGEFEDFTGIIRCFGKKVERVDGNALLFDLTEIEREKESQQSIVNSQ